MVLTSRMTPTTLALTSALAPAQHHLAEGGLARKQPRRQRLVDDANARSALAVAGGERPTCDQRDPHQREVVRADDAEIGERALRQWQNRPALDAVGRARIEAGQRQANRRRRIGHPGLRAQTFDHLVEELRLLRGSRVSRRSARRRTPRPHLRIEAGRRPLECSGKLRSSRL